MWFNYCIVLAFVHLFINVIELRRILSVFSALFENVPDENTFYKESFESQNYKVILMYVKIDLQILHDSLPAISWVCIIYRVLTCMLSHFCIWAALSWLLLQALVTNATGTFNCPLSSSKWRMACTAAFSGVEPRASTPSTSNSIPKSAWNIKSIWLSFLHSYLKFEVIFSRF